MASTSGSSSNTSSRSAEYRAGADQLLNGLNHGPFGEKNFNIPNGHWLAVKRFHLVVCDVARYDAAEFFGALLLELEAHSGAPLSAWDSSCRTAPMTDYLKQAPRLVRKNDGQIAV